MTEAMQEHYDGLLVDLDGVVYIGPEAVPGAVEALNSAQAAGLAVGYVTNNANRPAPDVAGHLRELGLDLVDADVVTSAQIAAALVRRRLGADARVLAVGGPGVALALSAEGLRPVDTADGAVAVVQGYGPDVGWRQLAEASYAIHEGAHWVATNTDLTIPQARGIAPGNGTLVAAVQAAVGIHPVVAGKPQAVAFEAAAERLGSKTPLVIGDRLDTDIEGGNAAHYDTLFVLTGVHGYAELASAPARQRPTFIATDLGCLGLPTVEVSVHEGSAVTGETEIRVNGGRLTRVRGTDQAEAIRATCALLWPSLDAGTSLQPDDELAEVLARRTVSADG